MGRVGIEYLLGDIYLPERQRIKEDLDQADGKYDDFLEFEGLEKAFSALDSYITEEKPSFYGFYSSRHDALLQIRRRLALFSSPTADGYLARHGMAGAKREAKEFIREDFCTMGYANFGSEIVDPETLVSDFQEMNQDERKKLLFQLHHLGALNSSEILWRLLPELGYQNKYTKPFYDPKKTRQPSDFQGFEMQMKKVKEEIIHCVQEWRARRLSDDAARFQILGGILYLKSLVLLNNEAFLVFKEMGGISSSLYEPVLFDTDFDGIVDQLDAFPTYENYQWDNNHNGIPDEMEKEARGPDHFYGLKEGEIQFFEQLETQVELYRSRGPDSQIYLVVNIPLLADEPKSKTLLPLRRLIIKRELEENFKKMMPTNVGPLHVRVNFYATPNIPVLLSGETIRSDTGHWALEAGSETYAHETGHYFGWRDRYQREEDEDANYITRCKLFSPGLQTLWNNPHLMNHNSFLIEPADMAYTIDIITRFSTKTEDIKSLGIADILIERGEFQEAEKIYLTYYEMHPASHRVISLAALRGAALAAIRYYEQTKELGVLTRINQYLSSLEAASSPERFTSPEAQGTYVDFLLLKGLLSEIHGKSDESRSFFKKAEEEDRFYKGELTREKFVGLFPKVRPFLGEKKDLSFGMGLGISASTEISSIEPLMQGHLSLFFPSRRLDIGIGPGLRIALGRKNVLFMPMAQISTSIPLSPQMDVYSRIAAGPIFRWGEVPDFTVEALAGFRFLSALFVVAGPAWVRGSEDRVTLNVLLGWDGTSKRNHTTLEMYDEARRLKR